MEPRELILARHGVSAYRIVVPDEGTASTDYAARELQRFVAALSGAKVPIVRETEAGPQPAFKLGWGAHTEAYRSDPAFTGLAEDGVYVRTDGEDVVLLGQNERAQIYSVYEFLERFFGVRFLAWDCTYVPRHDVLSLSPIFHTYSPPFMYREALYFNALEPETALRHRFNGPFAKLDASVGGKWVFHPYVHSFARLVPPEEHFDSHPEYFSLINGQRVGNACDAQLCLTNPDVLRLATARVFEWIERFPQVKIFDVSQNDGYGPCECPACSAVAEEEGSQHGPILRFVNAIADAVGERYPDRWIETLAYCYATKPPVLTRPRPNVIIRLCHVGNYFRGFEEDDRDSGFAGYLEEWTRLTPNVFIWHYATNFGHYLAPNQNLQGLVKDIKAYARHGVRGLMVQANYQSPGGELAELRQYLTAQLLWDPTRDPAVLRTEFCERYYEAARDEVLEFLARIDAEVEQAEDQPVLVGYANWDPQQTVRPEFVADALAILKRAEGTAGNVSVYDRIQKLKLPFRYMQLRYPERYGTLLRSVPEMLKEARYVTAIYGITQMREVICHEGPVDGERDTEDVQNALKGRNTMRRWLEQMEGRFTTPTPPVVLDLYHHLDDARLADCLVWRGDEIDAEGEPRVSVFQHPPATGYADGTYRVTLPDAGPLYLRFGTGFTAPTADGVRFAVLINGEVVWSHEQRSLPVEWHEVELTGYAGKSIDLTLRVDALQNHSFDWANWVEPRIVKGSG